MIFKRFILIKVSVIIPIYKVEKYIRRCILSVINQTFKNIELILINDATPDCSYEEARKIIDKYGFQKKTIFIEHDVNKGLSEARNSGLKVATGDYIFFLDSDDKISNNNVFESMIKKITYYNYPDILVANNQSVVNDNIVPRYPLKFRKYFNGVKIFSDFVMKDIYWSACGKFIKRDVILSNNLLFKTGIYSEDALWSYFLFQKCDSGVVISDVIYDYYDTPNSIMKNINDKHVQDMLVVIECIYQDFFLNKDLELEKIVFLEKLRRLALEYMFKYGVKDKVFVLSQLKRLQKIKLPILKTKNLRFFKQNILLRYPTTIAYKYLCLKWHR